jgi:hypothetical protein
MALAASSRPPPKEEAIPTQPSPFKDSKFIAEFPKMLNKK